MLMLHSLEDPMKNSLNKKQLGLACALALGLASGAALAQNFGPPNMREAWNENTKSQIWKNGFGECWHSQFGPPPGYNECNPAPVAQYVAPPPPPAPAPYVAPAPVQVPYVAPVAAPVYVAPPLPPRKPRG